MLEEAIRGDFAFIKAKIADEDGNLFYYRTANNFNKDMAVIIIFCFILFFIKNILN